MNDQKRESGWARAVRELSLSPLSILGKEARAQLLAWFDLIGDDAYRRGREQGRKEARGDDP